MKKFLFFLVFILFISLVNASIRIGEEEIETQGVVIEVPDAPIFQNITGFVNTSQFAEIWITTEGDKDDVSDILLDEIGDVSVGSPVVNDLIKWGGATWAKFTQTVLDRFLFFDSSHNIGFNQTALNESIDLRTASITYNASLISTVEGTLVAGNLASVQIIDSNWYNVSENSGGSPLLIYANFTGVDVFSNILLRIWYEGGQGHEIEIATWNYDATNWESHGDITDQSTITEIVIDVLDSGDHVSGGVVQLKFDHVQNGNANHDFHIDFIALQEGFTSITNAQHDGLLGRDDFNNNHPAYASTINSINTSETIQRLLNGTSMFFEIVNASQLCVNDICIGGWESVNQTFNATYESRLNVLNSTIIDSNASWLKDTTNTSAELYAFLNLAHVPFMNQSVNFTEGLNITGGNKQITLFCEGTRDCRYQSGTIADPDANLEFGSYSAHNNLDIKGRDFRFLSSTFSNTNNPLAIVEHDTGLWNFSRNPITAGNYTGESANFTAQSWIMSLHIYEDGGGNLIFEKI